MSDTDTSSSDDDGDEGAPSEFLAISNKKRGMVQLKSDDAEQKKRDYIASQPKSATKLPKDFDATKTAQWLNYYNYNATKLNGYDAAALYSADEQELCSVLGDDGKKLFKQLYPNGRKPQVPKRAAPKRTAPKRPAPKRPAPKRTAPKRPAPKRPAPKLPGSPPPQPPPDSPMKPPESTPLHDSKYKMRIFLPNKKPSIIEVNSDLTFNQLKDNVWKQHSLDDDKKEYVVRLWNGQSSHFFKNTETIKDFFNATPTDLTNIKDLTDSHVDLYIVKPGDEGEDVVAEMKFKEKVQHRASLKSKMFRQGSLAKLTRRTGSQKTIASKPGGTTLLPHNLKSTHRSKKKDASSPKRRTSEVSKFISPPAKWEDSKFCSECNKTGKLHNCRVCGKMFCGKCCAKMDVPDAFKKKKKQGPVRCCHKCIAEVEHGAELVEEEIAPPPEVHSDYSDEFIPPPPAPPEEEDEPEPVEKSWLKVYWQKGKVKPNDSSYNNPNISLEMLKKNPDFICRVEVELTTTLETIHTKILHEVGETKLAGWVRGAYEYIFNGTPIHSAHHFAFEARHFLPLLFIKDNCINLDQSHKNLQKKKVREARKSRIVQEEKKSVKKEMTKQQKDQWFKKWELGDREFTTPAITLLAEEETKQNTGISLYKINATFEEPAQKGLPPGAEEQDYEIKKDKLVQKSKISYKSRSSNLDVRSRTLFGAADYDSKEDDLLMSSISADIVSLPPPPDNMY